MEPLNYVLMYLGVITQIILSINKVLMDKQFDLKFWWDKNKWATIVSVAVLTGIAFYLNIAHGTDVDQTIQGIVPLIVGFITQSVSFHLFRKKTSS